VAIEKLFIYDIEDFSEKQIEEIDNIKNNLMHK